ncbi:MAG: electron transport complex subunit RsxC [Pseudomonadota bacterium]|jgi:electron transport complex protein RnfC
MGFMERFVGRWGVHPDDHKRPAADAPVRRMPMPARLYVPLLQHIGTAARPIVLAGQKVLKGQTIAEPQGMVSATIHAPTSGTVVAIGEIVAPHPSGLPLVAVTIETDGKDRWVDLIGSSDPFALDPLEVGKRVARAGVVGMGGATFPSAVKLGGGLRAKISTLIVNGGECEPYLSCDDRLMRDRAAEIVDGIRIALHATGAKEALVGIEDNKPEAIAAMQAAAAAYAEIKVKPVPARYPMGSEKQLILVLMGREVPAMGRPSDIGVLVHNVGTLVAVREAIRFGRPLISRLVTLNGGAARAPGNIEVPIGALVEEVIDFANGFKEAPARLLMGGPMMGMPLPHMRVPVVKGTSGILALTAAEVAECEPSPCIRCGRCVTACPIGLLPLEMARRIASADFSGAVASGLKDCIACGCCAYVCPSRIPLVQYFNHAKGELAAQERARLRAEAAKKLAAARAERVEREAREKAEAAARRKAERDAARAAGDAAKKTAAEATAANTEVTPT